MRKKPIQHNAHKRSWWICPYCKYMWETEELAGTCCTVEELYRDIKAAIEDLEVATLSLAKVQDRLKEVQKDEEE